jgi:hypothetical protein
MLPPHRSGKYPRGGSVRTRRPLHTRKACMCRGPTPKRSAAGGRIYCVSADAQGSQLQTFPRGSDELNFGYHVSACHSHGPRAVSRGKPCHHCMYQERWTSLGRHTRICIITVLYTTHHSCALLDTLFTRTYDPDLTNPFRILGFS